MKEITVCPDMADQRLDKLLARYLDRAPKSFIYKMLRKKNIVLNGKRAAGNERVEAGDRIRLYLSDETVAAFSAPQGAKAGRIASADPVPSKKKKAASGQPPRQALRTTAGAYPPLDIIYEDPDLLIVNKPAGMLSQKAAPGDVSVNEQILAYLADRAADAGNAADAGAEANSGNGANAGNAALTGGGKRLFTPSVCNRLDRNTSGLLAAGKTLRGARLLSRLFRERKVGKYYLCIVKGRPADGRIRGYLIKDEKKNRVIVTPTLRAGASPIETEYSALASGKAGTLLRVHLITGKPHQIRAHLASVGSPIAGDRKYGDPRYNAYFQRKYGLNCQLLHACRMEMPAEVKELPRLANQVWTAPVPELFGQILVEEYGDMEIEGASRLDARGAHQLHK